MTITQFVTTLSVVLLAAAMQGTLVMEQHVQVIPQGDTALNMYWIFLVLLFTIMHVNQRTSGDKERRTLSFFRHYNMCTQYVFYI